MDKPFDDILVKTMQDTMLYLCENIQNCVVGYTQSDEITLLLIDYQNKDSESWFGNNIQKMVSVSASMATLAFNMFFKNNDEYQKYIAKYNKALFDSRVFSLPKEEVVNCFIWRQEDAIKNSISSLGQYHFNQKQLNKQNSKEVISLLKTKNIFWEDFPTTLQRGSCCIRKQMTIETPLGVCERNKFVIDNDIPIFIDNKEYINNLVYLKKGENNVK